MFAALLALALAQPAPNHYRIDALRIHDGDTITLATVHLDFGVALTDQSIRLAGFDAPEVSRIRRTVEVTPEEIQRGIAARDALRGLLAAYPGSIYLRPVDGGRGVYGRLVGYLIVYPPGGPPIQVAEWMRARGFDREGAVTAPQHYPEPAPGTRPVAGVPGCRPSFPRQAIPPRRFCF